jgi:hypothetical protein
MTQAMVVPARVAVSYMAIGGAVQVLDLHGNHGGLLLLAVHILDTPPAHQVLCAQRTLSQRPIMESLLWPSSMLYQGVLYRLKKSGLARSIQIAIRQK